MSGWENVPDEAPKQPRAPRKRGVAVAATAAGTDAVPSDDGLVDDGELARFVDRYWPHAWLTMLTIVCLIAVYKAVDKLPNHPSWWP